MVKPKPITIRDFKTAAQRRDFLEKVTNHKFEAIGNHSFTEEEVSGRNIENLIGAVHIPLGVAGPISICGSQGTTSHHVPLATTEGALVASISRGCKAVHLSGGAIVAINSIGITRGPVFKTKNITHSRDVQTLINKNFTKLAKIAASTSNHLSLTKIDISFVGKNLYCRFYFDSSDAMGMNMATFASKEICGAIENLTGARLVSLAGNFDVDKKPSWLNFLGGRGKQVWAEITIPEAVVEETLKTTPAKIVEIVEKKQHLGSILSGSLGYNAHFANIVAAIFMATGQDVAHVVEGSLGITTAEVEKNGSLYFSIYMPALMTGTVGGGTSLPTQKEAISIMAAGNTPGVSLVASSKRTPGVSISSMEFAKIVAAAVLAGELSLTASLAEGSLAKAHKRLGRGGKKFEI